MIYEDDNQNKDTNTPMHFAQGKVVYPELSYQLVGILMDVHSKLGNKYQEKYYQRAVEEALQNSGLYFDSQLEVPLLYNDKVIGKYYLDFLVDQKIIIELKATPYLSKEDYRQVKAYLTAKKLQLGLLVNFRPQHLDVRRVLNVL